MQFILHPVNIHTYVHICMKVILRNHAQMDFQPTYAWFININTIAYAIYAAMHSALHELNHFRINFHDFHRLSRTLANREENILGVNFHECNLLMRFMENFPHRNSK